MPPAFSSFMLVAFKGIMYIFYSFHHSCIREPPCVFPGSDPVRKNPPGPFMLSVRQSELQRRTVRLPLADLEDHQGDVIELGPGSGEPDHILDDGGDNLPRRQVA